MVNGYFKACNIKFEAIMTISVLTLCLLVFVGMVYKSKISTFMVFLTDNYVNIMRMILVAAAFLVAYMALNSFNYSHLDEDASKAVVDYYVNHWKPANIRGAEVVDSFSAYGNARLSEVTVYYFLAGKVGWLAKSKLDLNKYCRAFNALLFAIIVGISVKREKERLFILYAWTSTADMVHIFLHDLKCMGLSFDLFDALSVDCGGEFVS